VSSRTRVKFCHVFPDVFSCNPECVLQDSRQIPSCLLRQLQSHLEKVPFNTKNTKVINFKYLDNFATRIRYVSHLITDWGSIILYLNFVYRFFLLELITEHISTKKININHSTLIKTLPTTTYLLTIPILNNQN